MFTACGIKHRRCCLLVTRTRWNWVPPHPGHQQAPSSVLYTTSCEHSLVLLRMAEIIDRNMLSWLKLLIIKLLLMYLVGCLYYCLVLYFELTSSSYFLNCPALQRERQSRPELSAIRRSATHHRSCIFIKTATRTSVEHLKLLNRHSPRGTEEFCGHI